MIARVFGLCFLRIGKLFSFMSIFTNLHHKLSFPKDFYLHSTP